MKSLVCLCLLFLMLQVTAKAPPVDNIYKAAAQICKPYFLQCKDNPEKEINDCFQDVYYNCLPKFREVFQSIEDCANDAGDDLQAVIACSNPYTEA